MKNPVKPIIDETEIIIVLDRSGSMRKIAKATVDGFNEFINEHKNADGDANITLVQFDDRYQLDYKSIPVREVSDLVLIEYGAENTELTSSFSPRGSTALLDAIGITINNTSTKSDVVFVIITDGRENASTEFDNSDITELIKNKEDNEGWKFIFLAANQDAIKTGGDMGIKGGRSMTYSATDKGAGSAFSSISKNTVQYRSSKFSGLDLGMATMDLDFKDEQRKEQ